MTALDAYEELVKLKDNPHAFAKRQKEIVEDAISKCPKEFQQQIRQNNWRIEQELSKFKNPTARMNKMVELFWNGVSKFEDTLRGNSISAEPRTRAKVIPFNK